MVIQKIYDEKSKKNPNFFLVTGDNLKDIDFSELNVVAQFDKPVDYAHLHREIIKFWDREKEVVIKNLDNCNNKKGFKKILSYFFN